MYDFHMALFGVREVAEKELHSFFMAIRKFATKHPRVRTFALFCGIPMTHTASTRGGFFNLDVHLRYSSTEAADTAAAAAAKSRTYLAGSPAHRSPSRHIDAWRLRCRRFSFLLLLVSSSPSVLLICSSSPDVSQSLNVG